MKRALRTATKHIRRSPYQAAAAIVVLAITFYLISLFSLVIAGTEKIIRHFETRPQVTAFFLDDTTDSQVSQLEQSIRQLDGIDAVNYITKQQALEIYRQQNQDDPLLLEMVTADILPASLEVSATDPVILPRVAELMANHPQVEEVVYQQNIIETLISWTGAIRIAGLSLVGFLLASSITMVMITVGIKIASRRKEINVMRLLGATRGHIIAPFLLEGTFYGLLGSVIGWGTGYVTLLYATPFILNFMGSIPLLPAPIWFMLVLLAGQLLLGILLGLSASALAAYRRLR